MERFKPNIGEGYCFVNSFGEVANDIWSNGKGDRGRYDTGNCFRNGKECQAKIDRDKAIASGRAVVVDVPEGWEVDGIWLNTVLHGESIDKHIRVYIKPTPPPPPKEITVRVYDDTIHGPAEPGRKWMRLHYSHTKYFYTDELEGL